MTITLIKVLQTTSVDKFNAIFEGIERDRLVGADWSKDYLRFRNPIQPCWCRLPRALRTGDVDWRFYHR